MMIHIFPNKLSLFLVKQMKKINIVTVMKGFFAII